MDVEIKIVEREDVPKNELRSVSIETHARRNDMYNVMKVDTMNEGETAMFRVPAGGRLMIATPEAEDEIVYDASQGAAIRRGSQVNDDGKADDARTGAERDAVQRGGLVGGVRPNTASGSISTVSDPGGQQTLQNPTQPPGSPQMRAPTSNPNPPQSNARRFGTTPTPDEAKRRAEEVEKAKQVQQSGAGRPAGEKPPAAGSPVGSPPSGNEGNK